jgi:hypothetical protein
MISPRCFIETPLQRPSSNEVRAAAIARDTWAALTAVKFGDDRFVGRILDDEALPFARDESAVDIASIAHAISLPIIRYCELLFGDGE